MTQILSKPRIERIVCQTTGTTRTTFSTPNPHPKAHPNPSHREGSLNSTETDSDAAAFVTNQTPLPSGGVGGGPPGVGSEGSVG